MADIILRNVCKRYEQNGYAVKNVDINIKDQEFLILVGPSGCGKSTTLRMIAGLEDISDGELWIGDQFSNYVESKNRDLAMVFQNYALYGHMTVFENMAFSLRIRKVPKKEIKERVQEVARILELEHLLDRRPADLSGGQKQRVAIGSAIIRKPKAFLMDEPLSNLDAKLRNQMRVELAKLHKELKTTIIYVTHDQTEAMTLGTRIAVMKDGLVQQIATPEELYNNPSNVFVAGFIGSPAMNFFNGVIRSRHGEQYVAISDAWIPLNTDRHEDSLCEHYMDQRVIVGIRPEDIIIREIIKQKTVIVEHNCLKGKVVAKEMIGAEEFIYFGINGQQYCVRTNTRYNVSIGDILVLDIDESKLKYFDEDTEQRIDSAVRVERGV